MTTYGLCTVNKSHEKLLSNSLKLFIIFKSRHTVFGQVFKCCLSRYTYISPAADDSGTTWGNIITRQNPTPNPLKVDDFLSDHFAGVLSCFTLMDLPSNVLNIQLFFPYPQLHMHWSFTKHRRKGGESYKQDLTHLRNWLDRFHKVIQ